MPWCNLILLQTGVLIIKTITTTLDTVFTGSFSAERPGAKQTIKNKTSPRPKRCASLRGTRGALPHSTSPVNRGKKLKSPALSIGKRYQNAAQSNQKWSDKCTALKRRINQNWGQAELPGVLSPSHLAGLLHGAGRGDPLILLISEALGEAGSELAGVEVGNRAARESAGSKRAGREPVFATVIFAFNIKKHLQLMERELLTQAVQWRPKKCWSFGSPVHASRAIGRCYTTSPRVLARWPPHHQEKG